MEAKTRKIDGVAYPRYAVNRQVFAADVYPFSAPDGSNIIVCGHETGLLVVWRGRKATNQNGNHESRRDAGEDEDMTGEESGDQEQSEEAQQAVTHKLDLALGTAVLHIAFPRLPQLARPQETPLSPTLLQNNLLVTFACADGSIRVLTLPLQSPPASKINSKEAQEISKTQLGKGFWGERLAIIPHAHQNIAKGISVGFISREITRSSGEDNTNAVDVLIASHSADLRGSLLIHRIPIQTSHNGSFGQPELWRSRSLAAPAASIDLHIGQGSDSTPKVLVAESTGAVRIFETVSSKHSSGRWTLSLFAPTSKASEASSLFVFSARWILNGQAVAVLTVDGWGIWNISHGGTSHGISGARPTSFTISGRIGTSTNTAIASKSTHEKADSRSQLAPMTPATRKVRQENLFTGRAESSTKRGGISIKYSSPSLTSGESDESLLFWHGDTIVHLPSLRTLWQNKFSGSKNASLSAASGHLRDVPFLNLGGEARIAVSAFPANDSSTTSKGLDVLVAGDRSLTISSQITTTKHIKAQEDPFEQSQIRDRSLLSQGLLDINGLNRVLGSMGDGRRPSTTEDSRTFQPKKVNFLS